MARGKGCLREGGGNLKTGMGAESRRHSGGLCMKAFEEIGEFRCPNGAPYDSLGQRPRKRAKIL